MTEFTEPLWQIGDLGQLESSPGGAIILPEPSGGNMFGPSGFESGYGVLDVRYTFLKDLVTGYTGRVPALLANFRSVLLDAIPMANATNNLVTAQAVTSGTAMTLVSAAAQGVAINVPIVPFTGVLNSLGTATTATNAPVVLDFGFAWGATTANGSAVTVADSTIFMVGQPLVMPHMGAASGALTSLLTNVVSIASATVIQVGPGVPLTTSSFAPIGFGNSWGPSEFASSSANSPYPIPTAHLPYLAMGPGLFLDPRQSISRSIAVTSAGTASTGSVTISGWDVFWAPITDTITVTGRTITTTAYTTKTFKAISSIVPNVTDTHTWSIGTGDVFGMPMKVDRAELATIWWAGVQMVSTTGFTVPDFTSPASAITGDVRGTIAVGTAVSGTGAAGGVSNGTVSSGSLTVTGSRLVVNASLSTFNQLVARLTQPQWQMGRPQA